MKTVLPIFAVSILLAGCAQTNVAQRNDNKRHIGYLARPDYFKTRRTITGSNIPVPRNQVTSFGLVYANTPAESIDRERPSLYPTEPVVGATPNTEPGTEPANVGAGPAGSNPSPSSN